MFYFIISQDGVTGAGVGSNSPNPPKSYSCACGRAQEYKRSKFAGEHTDNSRENSTGIHSSGPQQGLLMTFNKEI